MFKRFTKKIVAEAKTAVTEEVDKTLPTIITVVTLALGLYMAFESPKTKTITPNLTIINNFYFYGGVKK